MKEPIYDIIYTEDLLSRIKAGQFLSVVDDLEKANHWCQEAALNLKITIAQYTFLPIAEKTKAHQYLTDLQAQSYIVPELPQHIRVSNQLGMIYTQQIFAKLLEQEASLVQAHVRVLIDLANYARNTEKAHLVDSYLNSAKNEHKQEIQNGFYLLHSAMILSHESEIALKKRDVGAWGNHINQLNEIMSQLEIHAELKEPVQNKSIKDYIEIFRAEALVHHAIELIFENKHSEAIPLLNRSIHILQPHSENSKIADIYNLWGEIGAQIGDEEQDIRYRFEQANAYLDRAEGNQSASQSRIELYINWGDFERRHQTDRARELLEKAVKYAEFLKYRKGLIGAKNFLAYYWLDQKKCDLAEALFNEVVSYPEYQAEKEKYSETAEQGLETVADLRAKNECL